MSNEGISLNEQGVAVVTWNTNLQATSMVVYDLISHGTPTFPALVTDYASATSKSSAYVTSHSVPVPGLVAGRTYYFRPYSDRSDDSELGIELMIHPTSTTAIASVINIPCTEYLKSYIKLGEANDPYEVKKLELFLNAFEGFNLPVDGIYDQRDFEAVGVFQERYFNDVLAPWGHTEATGYVYYTTRKKVNEIYCKSLFPLTPQQQVEVDEFRALLERLRREGGVEEVDTSIIGGAEPSEEAPIFAEIFPEPTTEEFSPQPRGFLAQLFGPFWEDLSRTMGIILMALAGSIGLASIWLVSRRRNK